MSTAAGTGTSVPCERCCRRRLLLCFLVLIGYSIVFSVNTDLDNAQKIIGHSLNATVSEAWWTALQESHYVGYVFGAIISGVLTLRLSAMHIFGMALLVISLVSLVLPFLITSCFKDVMLKIIFGAAFAKGLLYPACIALWIFCSSPSERAILVSIALSGPYVGALLGSTVNAAIPNSMSWEFSYYVNGVTGIIWVFFWETLAFQKTENHMVMADIERNYLESTRVAMRRPTVSMSIPWCKIFSTASVYAIIGASFSRMWCSHVLQAFQPQYLAQQYDYAILELSSLNSSPYAVLAVAAPVIGLLADWLIRSKKISATDARKNVICSCFAIQGLSFLILFLCSAMPLDFVVTIFVTIKITSELILVTYCVNLMEISPRFGGFLLMITELVGFVSSGICQIMGDNFLVSRKSKFEVMMINWQQLFLYSAMIQLTGLVMFFAWGSSRAHTWVQPANDIVYVPDPKKWEVEIKRRVQAFVDKGPDVAKAEFKEMEANMTV